MPQVGDVVKYGQNFWQWGRVIEIEPGRKREVCVRRRNKIWVARDAIQIVIPAKSWNDGLFADVIRGEPFTEAP